MKKLKIVLSVMLSCFIFLGLYLSQTRKKEYSATEFVLDTSCSVTFYGRNAKEAADAVFAELRRLDDLMSLYKSSSEVSKINAARAGEAVSVSKDTYEVLKTALEICEKSGGAFDITLAPVTMLWGFGSKDEKIPEDKELKSAVSKTGYEKISLKDGQTVIKSEDGVKIDLGGAAKGYAGDCARKVAKSYGLTGGIIDLGGNIICFGENPKSDDKKWTIGIQIPFEPSGTYEKTVVLDEGAVVTSGIYQRYFELDEKLYHHIIDPKTGYPARRDYKSVTVVLDNSLKADCLATAAYVLDKESAKTLIEQYKGEIYYEY